MPELSTMEKPKTAGFVDRGFNHAKKQERIKQEEAEIARLEAEARGEEVVEDQPSGENTEDTEVQATDDPKQEEATEETKAQEDDSELTAEEKSFKKRYGDLRRHMQEKEKEWTKKLENLATETRIQEAAVPTSEDELITWMEKNPESAGAIRSLIQKEADSLFGESKKRLVELDEAYKETTKLKAENIIRKTHEDFDELRQSDKFHNWAEAQPKWVKDALYENMDDPGSVIRVIDLYKIDNGMNIAAKKQSKKAAASSVSKGTRTTIDAEGLSNQLKESDVAKMSDKEFEDRQDEINEAMRNGKFVYDVSGAAR